MPTFRSLKKIIIPSRRNRFLSFIEQFIAPTPSRERSIPFIYKLANPGVKRPTGELGFLYEFINPRTRRYGFWASFLQIVSPEPPRSGIMGVVNAFLDAPVYRLQQSRDIIRPRQREANLLQRLISGINELLNAYTHFADLFKKPESILETPTDAFKDALEKVIFSSRVRIDRLTEELFRGQITPQQFHARMRAEVSRINLAAGFLGIRGIGNATVEALGSISERVARELIRLDNFMRDTFGANFTRDLTTAPISAPQFRAYSLRFASAGRATSTVAQTAMMQDLYGASIEVGGRLYMRRVLTPGAAHCDDCIAYAESGWIPVDDGTLPPPGVDCECQENCKCMLEFALASNPTNLPDDIAY